MKIGVRKIDPIKIGIIGCGKIAEKHINAICNLGSDAELVALCDINKVQIDKLLKKVNYQSSTLSIETDISQFLKRDIDLVVITTSTDSHIPLAHQALQAQKHVLVEKPLSLSIEEAKSIVEEATRAGRILTVSLQTRYLTQIQAIKKALEDNRFGRLHYGVVTVRWNRNPEYYKTSPWRGTWAKDGGVLMNQCIHYIDLLQWLMGPVVSVYGQGGTFVQPIEAEDVGMAVLRFANGAFGIIEGTTGIYDKNIQTSISLFGENGYVSIEGERLNKIAKWSFKNKRTEDELIINQIDNISHTPLYKDLINAIRFGSKPVVSVDSTLNSLETILAIYKSILEQRPIMLPLNNFSTKDMINLKDEMGKNKNG